MNLLSALCTALAGAFTARLVAREARVTQAGTVGAVMAGALAGLMCTAWANATETEVYALALLHVVLMLACAANVDAHERGMRWLALTAYVIALAPAVHLSALVGAPAAIVLAARGRDGTWSWPRALLLTAVLVAAAGVGRTSLPLIAVAIALAAACHLTRAQRGRPARDARYLLLVPLAASALLIMLVRARHDPAMNQGNPATLDALVDVVTRRQYAVASLMPRQAPAWLQIANVAQYADWQFAMGWGQGVFTSAARVGATLAYLILGLTGWRAMRGAAPRLASALLVLVLCGSVGVAAYLNLKAGASLGWGALPDGVPHEARERDYFFVLGFWGWGCLAGWGAFAMADRIGRPWLAVIALAVPLAANWRVVDRAGGSQAHAARSFADALLSAVPQGGVLFTSGDNDSYPLWYLQQVEGARPDVQVVTLPLLPAEWYGREIARRTGWRWDAAQPVAGAEWRHEQTAAAIARAAAGAHRPVVASPALTLRERALLGGGWVLRGPVYVATAGAPLAGSASIDTAAARRWTARWPAAEPPAERLPDDVTPMMLRFLGCPRLSLPWPGSAAGRDSLEVRCNFR
ncbi:MAG: hypothetical protein JWN79_776 [Gemmatimonadetes bacterium]|nr:hypothetical protein [Gemmatimonadota bacterium]